jgi:peptidoglycan biosynthesis protein MviN/MurJ (putative lipid II flippase)
VGLVGQTVCFVATQASYARGDTVGPLWCMAAQTVGCLILCATAVLLWDGPALVPRVAAAYAVATLAGGLLLLVMVARRSVDLLRRLGAAAVRIGAGVAVMAVPVRLCAGALQHAWPGREGSAVVLLVCSPLGIALFLAVEHLIRSPELAWWRAGLTRRRPERDRVEEPVP